MKILFFKNEDTFKDCLERKRSIFNDKNILTLNRADRNKNNFFKTKWIQFLYDLSGYVGDSRVNSSIIDICNAIKTNVIDEEFSNGITKPEEEEAKKAVITDSSDTGKEEASDIKQENKALQNKDITIRENFYEEIIKYLNALEEDYVNVYHEKNYDKNLLPAYFFMARSNAYFKLSEYYTADYNYQKANKTSDYAKSDLWNAKFYLNSLNYDNNGKLSEKNIISYLASLNIAKIYRDAAKRNRRSDRQSAFSEYNKLFDQLENIDGNEIIEINTLGTIDDIKRIIDTIYIDGYLDFIGLRIKAIENNSIVSASEKETIVGYREVFACLKPNSVLDNPPSIKKIEELWNTPEDNVSSIKKFTPLFVDEIKTNNQISVQNYFGRFFLISCLKIGRLLCELHNEEMFKLSYDFCCSLETSNVKYTGTGDKKNIDITIIQSLASRKYCDYTGYLPGSDRTVDINDNKYQESQNEFVSKIEIIFNELLDKNKKGEVKSKLEMLKWCALNEEKSHRDSSIKVNVENPIFAATKFKEMKKEIQKKYDFYERELTKAENSNKHINIYEVFLVALLNYEKEEYKKSIVLLKWLASQPECKYIRKGTLGLRIKDLIARCYISRGKYRDAKMILEDISSILCEHGNDDTKYDGRVEVDYIYCLLRENQFDECIDKSCSLINNNHIFSPKNAIWFINNFLMAVLCNYVKGEPPVDSLKDLFNKNSKKLTDNVESNIAQLIDLLKAHFDISENKLLENKEYNMILAFSMILTGFEDDGRTQKIHEYLKTACGMDIDYDLMANKNRTLSGPKIDHNKNKEINRIQRFSACLIYLNNKCEKSFKEIVPEGENITPERIEVIKEKNFNPEQLCKVKKAREDFNRFKRIILHLPSINTVSLRATIAIAKWIDLHEKLNNYGFTLGKEPLADYKECTEKNYILSNDDVDELYGNFGNIKIYEEYGVSSFIALKKDDKFRILNAINRGKFIAKALLLYENILNIKENHLLAKIQSDQPYSSHIPGYLAHYTTLGTLKALLKIPDKKEEKEPSLRLSNIGYLNDSYEGKLLLDEIRKKYSDAEKTTVEAGIGGDVLEIVNEDGVRNEIGSLVDIYFPQYKRDFSDMVPVESKIYIASLSGDDDSFPMWQIYSDQERGCNIKFDKEYFDLHGTVKNDLKEYRLSYLPKSGFPVFWVSYIPNSFIRDGGDNAFGDDFKYIKAMIDKWKNIEILIYQHFKCDDSVKNFLRIFIADRISEIRFLYKDDKYEYENEYRVIYAAYKNEPIIVDLPNREEPAIVVERGKKIKNVEVKLGSMILDLKVDRYVSWLNGTKKVKRITLARTNRYPNPVDSMKRRDL